MSVQISKSCCCFPEQGVAENRQAGKIYPHRVAETSGSQELKSESLETSS